jgi:hypothetical protein
MKSWMVSWLSLKTKVAPRLHGSQVWRRIHQVRGVCSGSPENHWVSWLSHNAKAEDSVWLSGQNRSDQLVKLVRPVWGRRALKCFEAEDTRRDHMAYVKAKRSAIAGHLSDGATTKIPKVPLEGVYPSVRL